MSNALTTELWDQAEPRRRRLFVYFKWRYTRQQIDVLNNALRERHVCNCLSLNISFLKQCRDCGGWPNSIQKRVHKAKACHSLSIERVFLKDDRNKKIDYGFSIIYFCYKIHSKYMSNK